MLPCLASWTKLVLVVWHNAPFFNKHPSMFPILRVWSLVSFPVSAGSSLPVGIGCLSRSRHGQRTINVCGR